MTVTRQTLHNLLFNHGVENNELLDALAWKFAKLMDEHDVVRAEIDRLREALTRIAKMKGTYGYEETYSAGASANEIALEALKGASS